MISHARSSTVFVLVYWASRALNVSFQKVLKQVAFLLSGADDTLGLGIPSYASSIKQGCFPKVLRNLHYPAIILNVTAMLLVLALVPLDAVLSGANVLSLLAENVSGVLCLIVYLTNPFRL